MATGTWPAIDDARRADAGARVPLAIVDRGRMRPVGSVARHHLPLLARWSEALRVGEDGVALLVPAADRVAWLADANRQLHAAHLVRGWRDETYGVPALDDGTLLATMERAAARFWGITTYGAHCNGYVAGPGGQPSHIWIARRALTKPTDPGLLDNLVGGGVPHGQSPFDCVLREGWEEAGLTPAHMAGLQPGRRLLVARDVAEGFQREVVSVYDLALPHGLVPHNQDGEVHSITCMRVAEALARAAGGEMTVDASLVTLDFALRRRLLPPDAAGALAHRAAGLWLGASRMGSDDT